MSHPGEARGTPRGRAILIASSPQQARLLCGVGLALHRFGIHCRFIASAGATTRELAATWGDRVAIFDGGPDSLRRTVQQEKLDDAVLVVWDSGDAVSAAIAREIAPLSPALTLS